MAASSKRCGVLVGVDGSPASNFAVCWAARDAAMRNVPLTLVHMVNATTVWPQVPMAAEAVAWQEDDGRRVLQEAVKIAEDATRNGRKLAITTELWHAPPAPTLAQLSEEAELVVVGSTGRGAIGRVLLGSVSSGLVRRARCPVAVIHDEDPMMPYRSGRRCWSGSTARRHPNSPRRSPSTKRHGAVWTSTRFMRGVTRKFSGCPAWIGRRSGRKQSGVWPNGQPVGKNAIPMSLCTEWWCVTGRLAS